MIANFWILCALVPLAFAKDAPKIAGGTDANIEDFPFQVSLQTVNDGKLHHFCGGSILTKEWILTAAHCLKSLTKEQIDKLVVVAGSTKLSEAAEKGQTIKYGGEYHIHPAYKGEVKPNDIAVIKIAPGLQFNDKVQPVRLPESGSKVHGKVLLSGWGSTRYILNAFFQNTSDTLKRATYKIMSFLECHLAFLTATMNGKANICTETTGIMAVPSSGCSGDSGGPLTQKGIQVGIVSWGNRICGIAPTVYTQVSNYIDFVKRYVPDVYTVAL